MMNEAACRRIQMEITQLCHSALDSHALRAALLERLQTVVPFDYVYFSTTDPATRLGTSTVMTEAPPPWMMPVFVDNEFLQADFNKFSDMIRDRQPVSTLSDATRNDMRLSRRYRDMLAPLSMHDELRAIFVTGGACWGTLCLHRGQVAYSPGEADFLAGLTPHIANGLRMSLQVEKDERLDTTDGPGVLILAEDLSVVAITSPAEHWLAELARMERGDKDTLPLPVRSAAASLRAMEQGTAPPGFTPKVRLRTLSGQWLLVYASRLKSAAGDAQISIMFEAAQPAEIAPIILLAYDLTQREGEIVQCILRGWPTGEIASRLHITPNTVQDHLKAIFEKVDVGSRGELAARIFTRQLAT